PLVLDYGWPAAGSIADAIVPAAIIVTLIGLTVWGLVRRRPIAFAGVWFFVILAPTSSVIPIVTEVAAEHRMYLPLAAIVSVLVLGAFSLLHVGRAFQTRHARGPERAALLVMSGAIVVLFAVMTDARNRDYQSFDRIWLDTIAKRPGNARARVNYASSRLEQREYREAEEHLRAAIAIEPDYPEAHGE